MLSSIDESISFIHSAGRFGKKAGLENIGALLACIGNPQNNMRYIHVAGTNGKGSVARLISGMLAEHGLKVGTNTSPYIMDFRERLCINNEPISPKKLIYYTNIVKTAVDTLNKKGIHPIEFEIIAAIGFLFFRDEKCDVVVLECGLGGRFDATNIIQNPVMCVITSIGLDHTAILGNTVEKIAFEKAGIIKSGAAVVTHPYIDAAALDVVEKKSADVGANVVRTCADIQILSHGADEMKIRFCKNEYETSLVGTFQAGNAALAINAARHLPNDLRPADDEIRIALKKAEWMCRFERIGKRYVLDGAHNYQGICEFAKSVRMFLPKCKKIFIVGMLNDKDYESSSKILSELGGRIIVTDVPSARQTNGFEVYKAVSAVCGNVEYITDYVSALKKAEEYAGDNGMICAVGSLYLVGALRKQILVPSHDGENMRDISQFKK